MEEEQVDVSDTELTEAIIKLRKEGLSYRQIEQKLATEGLIVSRSTANRIYLKFQQEQQIRLAEDEELEELQKEEQK